MTQAGPIRVIKVGGSLFDFPDLVPALKRFLGRQSSAANVLIAGGGPWANAIRDADDRFQIGEATAHELCICAMAVTARLLAALVPQWPLETSWEKLRSWTGRVESLDNGRVLDVQSFLTDFEPKLPGHAIPQDWTATSDSIAARVAGALNATELVLLKSAAVASETSMEQAAKEGYVDRFFPRAARDSTRIRCVNLRDPLNAEGCWEFRCAPPIGSDNP